MARRALISGASIAGPALARRLRQDDWEVVVVERAPALPTGGHNVDVRGAGREALRRMHLEDAVLARGTGELGTRFVRADGSTVATFPAGTDDTGGATAEAEILRGDLARLLVDAADGVEYRYGNRITAVQDGTDRATVSFADGPSEDFDLVVVAEGLRSATRRLVFGREVLLRPLGLEMTFLTIPSAPDDDRWWRWYNAPGGRSVSLRPDPYGTTRALLAAQVDRRAPDVARLGDDERNAWIRERFRDAGWQTPRILDALDAAEDTYSQSIAQVGAPRWSKGHVVLLGDAAYCPSPVSGMGTTLALVGAAVLGQALAREPDVARAADRYERQLRPYVERAQHLPPGTPAAANPMSRAGIAVLHAVLRVGASGVGQFVRRTFQRPPADEFTLPDD